MVIGASADYLSSSEVWTLCFRRHFVAVPVPTLLAHFEHCRTFILGKAAAEPNFSMTGEKGVVEHTHTSRRKCIAAITGWPAEKEWPSHLLALRHQFQPVVVEIGGHFSRL